MKSSTKDNTEGKIHQIKGKLKEVVGRVINDHGLEAEGKIENFDGKIQEKLSQIKKVVNK